MAALTALLAAFAASAAFTAANAHALDPVTGRRRALVVVVQWGDVPGFPASTPRVTPGEFADIVTDQVNPWYASVSRGMFLGWDVASTGPYTIDPRDPTRPDATCNTFDPVTWIATQAQAAARADGFDVDAYDNVVIYNEGPSACPWTSRANRGGPLSYQRGPNKRVIIHELGHNLGLNHSGTLVCRDGAGRQVTLSHTCTTTDYGDEYSEMGDGVGSFAASQQAALGWMGQRKLDLTIGDQPAHLILQPLESTGLTIQAVRVEDLDATYWVEYRASLGVDTTPPNGSELTGVVIRRQGLDDPTRSILLDMVFRESGEIGFFDADLPAGQSWTDPHGELRYTVNSIGPLGADITIEKKYAPVPDVVGLLRGEAATALGAAGYVVGRTQFQVDTTCNHVDRVKDQTPGAGRRLPPGTAVDLTVGTRPTGGCP